MSSWTELAARLARDWDLTEREHEALRLGLTGTCRRYLAGEMGLAEKTVEKHLKRLLEKAHAQGYDGERFDRLVADVMRKHSRE